MPALDYSALGPAGPPEQVRNIQPGARTGVANGGLPPPIDSRTRSTVNAFAPALPDLQALQRIPHTIEERELAAELATNGRLGPGITADDLLRLGMARMRELKGQVDKAAAVNAAYANYSLNQTWYECEFADHARRTGQARDGVREGMIAQIADREGGLPMLLNASDDEILSRFNAMVRNDWVGG